MAKSKQADKKPKPAAAPAPTRFVRRRRSSRRRRAENKQPEPSQIAPEIVAAAPDGNGDWFDAGRYDQRWGKAPRPAEPPPRNPNVFSYTYRVWKTS